VNCRISIITATFNSSVFIASCLDSVSTQTIPLEHIIVDGGSIDATLDIVRSYPHVSKIVSEPDRGIYDAMNKGIGLATNDIIGILNSDDFYVDNYVLERVAQVFADPSIDSCYSDLQYVTSDTKRIIRHWRAGHYKAHSFFCGWMPPHPTFFVRSSVYERFGLFNLGLGSAADYELMLRFLVKYKVTTAYIPLVLVKMRSGGTSNSSFSNRLKAHRMDRKAWFSNDLAPYPWTIILKPLRKISQYLNVS
jgi:glycosyltransferase